LLLQEFGNRRPAFLHDSSHLPRQLGGFRKNRPASLLPGFAIFSARWAVFARRLFIGDLFFALGLAEGWLADWSLARGGSSTPILLWLASLIAVSFKIAPVTDSVDGRWESRPRLFSPSIPGGRRPLSIALIS
jgi:hypothetical protein